MTWRQIGLLVALVWLCPSILSAGGVQPSSLELVTYPTFITLDRTVQTDRVIRLQQTYQPIAQGWNLEAESATLAFAPGGGYRATDEGGIAVHRVERLDLPLAIERQGAYTVWYRASFPFKATWCHTEQLAGQTINVMDSDQVGEDAWGTWVWIRGGTYELKPGTHHLQLNWMGGTELDRIAVVDAALTRDTVMALPRSQTAGTTGSAISGWITPSSFDRWVDLAADLPALPGVRYEIMEHGQRTWTSLDRQRMPTGAFRLRITLQTTPLCLCPVVPALAFRYLPTADELFVLTTSRGRAVFSKTTGNLLVVQDAEGYVLYKSHGNSALFGIDLYEADPRTSLAYRAIIPEKAAFRQHEEAGVWTFQLANGLRAELIAREGLDATIELRLIVRNGETSLAVKPHFPVLNGMLTGPRVKLHYPLFTGQVLNNLGGHPFRTEMTYPGNMASQWVVISEEDRGGIAFGAFDPAMRQMSYHLGVEKTGAPLQVSRHCARRLEPGEEWEPTAFVLAPFTGDWRQGAKPYRDWVLATKQQPRPNGYIDHAQGFLNCGLTEGADYSLMPWIFDMARQRQLRLTYWWGEDGIGACPAHYVTPPIMGGPTIFKAGNVYGKASGITAGYYMNSQLYTKPNVVGKPWLNSSAMSALEPEAQREPLLLTAAQVKDAEVRPLNGSSAYAYWIKMTAVQPQWRQYLTAWVRHYLTTYGANHMYFDQLLADSGENVWVTNTADGSIGAWMEGYRAFAQELNKTTAGIPGRHYFPTEGFSEFGDALFSYGLWASTKNAGEDPGGYRLGRQAVQTPDYGKFLLPWGNWFEYHFHVDAPFNALLYNVPLAVGPLGNQPREDQRYIEAVNATQRFRAEFNLLWSGARYQDTLGVQRAPAGLRVRTYEGDPRLGRFEFAALIADEPMTGSASPGPLVITPQVLQRINAVWLFTPGQATPLPYTYHDGNVSVELPAVKMGYLLLVDDLPTMVRLDTLPWEAEPGASLSVDGTVFRWTAANRERTLNLAVNGQRFTISLPRMRQAGVQPITVRVRLPKQLDADNLAEITQRLPDGGQHILGYVSGRPTVRARAYVSHADEALILQIENPTEREQTYRIAMTLPEKLGWVSTLPQQVQLPPRGTGEWRAQLAGVRDLDTRLFFSGEVMCRDERIPVHASVQPPIFDGGFEQSVSNEGKYGFSEFWNRPEPSMMPPDLPLAFLGQYIDTERVHSGAQSLRCEAKRQSPRAGIISLQGRAEAGRRYRLSAWFYREHANDSVTVQLAGYALGGGLAVAPTANDPVGQWFKLEAEMTRPAVPNVAESWTPFVIFHTYIWSTGVKTGSVWVDDVHVDVIE
jgi:hypothetical protein